MEIAGQAGGESSVGNPGPNTTSFREKLIFWRNPRYLTSGLLSGLVAGNDCVNKAFRNH
jgi:hypothetical protein